MVNLKLFRYASPPRTGTHWVMKACWATGLSREVTHARVHEPHSLKPGLLRVTTVRHPCSWLESYYREVHPAICRTRCTYWPLGLRAERFEYFVEDYLSERPGQIGRMIEDYGAEVYLRLEDFPWCLEELLTALGVPSPCARAASYVPAANCGRHTRKPIRWDPDLWRRVVQSEARMMEHFGYDYYYHPRPYGEHALTGETLS